MTTNPEHLALKAAITERLNGHNLLGVMDRAWNRRGRNRLIMVSCEYDQRQGTLSDRLSSNNLPAAPQVKDAGCD